MSLSACGLEGPHSEALTASKNGKGSNMLYTTITDALNYVSNTGMDLEAPASNDGLAEYLFLHDWDNDRTDEGAINNTTENHDRLIAEYLISVGVDPKDYGLRYNEDE